MHIEKCPYGDYRPYRPTEPHMVFAAGICLCDGCYSDRLEWMDVQPSIMELAHPDDGDDDALDRLASDPVAIAGTVDAMLRQGVLS